MATEVRVFKLRGGDRIDIVGEWLHNDALRQARGPIRLSSTMRWASLVPDRSGAPDLNSINVVIDGARVGRLGRDAAAAFRPLADRIVALGCDAQCAAIIYGSEERPGVALDLASVAECVEQLVG